MGLVEKVVGISKFAKGLMLSSKSKNMASEIHSDLLIEILKRLPFKSMARFKCVSKLWSSLIHSLGHLFPSPPRLYLTSDMRHDCDIMDEVCPYPAKSELFSFSFTSTGKSSAVFDLDLTKKGIGGRDMDVLRGLLLSTVCGKASIYNPTTGQRVGLPAIEVKMDKKNYYKELKHYLGYDPVLDQYKAVCSTMVQSVNTMEIYAQHWWVFVLEEGSSWKRIEFDHLHSPSSGLCINGVIYYLADWFMSGRLVISFDVRSEEFSMIQAPMVFHGMMAFIEYGGKPTIVDYRHLQDPSGLLDLWVLQDAEKWSKKSVVLQPCLMHFFPDNIRFDVIGTTQNDELILKPEEMPSPYILYYDLHKNDMRKVDIRGIPEEAFGLSFTLMDTGENIMHLKI